MTAAGEERQVDPLLGRLVDERFELQAFLGSGAVGSVYRATDRTTGQRTALKIWNATVLDEQTLGRFRREATALTTLCHPNIVGVVGWGVMDDLPYVALEYLEGDTLERLLTNHQPLDTDFAFDVARQMLAALAYAHGLGVVHRDFKPDNVFVTGAIDDRAGRPSLRLSPPSSRVVKLLDFGLAKFLSPEADPVKGALTMHGMIMGTPLYMPPEQAAGRTIDARVDVYAAGCVLFEMLSGQPPYLGDSNSEILRQHMVAPLPTLADHRPDVVVSPALEDFFQKALAKRPEQRFADAGQMLEALNALPRPALRKRSDVAPPASASPRSDRAEASNGASDRLQLLAAIVTGVVTALALAYALLH